MKNGLTFPSSISFLSQLPLQKALNISAPNEATMLLVSGVVLTGCEKVRKYIHMFLVLSTNSGRIKHYSLYSLSTMST